MGQCTSCREPSGDYGYTDKDPDNSARIDDAVTRSSSWTSRLRRLSGKVDAEFLDADGYLPFPAKSAAPYAEQDLRKARAADQQRSATILGRQLQAADQEGSGSFFLFNAGCDFSAEWGKGYACQRNPRVHQCPCNAANPIPFDNTLFTGKLTLMFKPKNHSELRDYPYRWHFHNRKRIWECRLQGRFKKMPTGELFVGLVLKDFDYNQAVAWHSRFVRNAGLAFAKVYGPYMNWGDRCEHACKPDAELSHCVTDMTGWDQMIVTRRGEEPPNLASDLSGMGLLRGGPGGMGVSAYKAAVNSLMEGMTTENTYTMCFWGCSQVVDVVIWQVSFSRAISGMEMDTFFANNPLHGVVYELDWTGVSSEDRRHLESRKRYYADFMFWSNKVKPTHLPESYNFIEAPTELQAGSAGNVPSGDAPPRRASSKHLSNGVSPERRESRKFGASEAEGAFAKCTHVATRRDAADSQECPRGRGFRGFTSFMLCCIVAVLAIFLTSSPLSFSVRDILSGCGVVDSAAAGEGALPGIEAPYLANRSSASVTPPLPARRSGSTKNTVPAPPPSPPPPPRPPPPPPPPPHKPLPQLYERHEWSNADKLSIVTP